MFEQQLKSMQQGQNADQREFLLRAFVFAQEAHEGQLRKSGEPYFMHPVAVAELLWHRFHDLSLSAAGLLHDTVEDNPKVTIEQIYEQFGKEVGFLVDALTKKATGFYNSDMVIEDRTERLLWAGMQDIRAFLLKIADREHNINTLKHLKTNKQVRIAFETQAIYEPLKQIIGFYFAGNVDEARRDFEQYLATHRIETPTDLKFDLYSQFYKDFNHELYDLVYNNSEKVVWEIEDQKCLERMLKSRDFEEHANIHSMWTDGEKFYAKFTFGKGYLVDNQAGLKVASYQS